MVDVLLTKQSYKEAKEAGLVPHNATLKGIVFGSNMQHPTLSADAIDAINRDIIEQAELLGATIVFGIEYRGVHADARSGTMGYGDAYKEFQPVR